MGMAYPLYPLANYYLKAPSVAELQQIWMASGQRRKERQVFEKQKK
jgi:hypothetical protein